MSQDRRKAEIDLLKKKYGEVDYGPNFDWVLVKRFRLPSGYNRDFTELLFLIPAGYPTTPPDNFFVPNGLRSESGQVPGNYTENQSVAGRAGWAQFSYHPNSAWYPSSDHREGDNLVTFMLAVERRLQERS